MNMLIIIMPGLNARGLQSKLLIPYSGLLLWEKTFANFAFLWQFAKVFSTKIYFQAIRYRASGRGALGYCKFAKVFSAKIYFQAIRESFLPRKKPAIR